MSETFDPVAGGLSGLFNIENENKAERQTLNQLAKFPALAATYKRARQDVKSHINSLSLSDRVSYLKCHRDRVRKRDIPSLGALSECDLGTSRNPRAPRAPRPPPRQRQTPPLPRRPPQPPQQPQGRKGPPLPQRTPLPRQGPPLPTGPLPTRRPT